MRESEPSKLETRSRVVVEIDLFIDYKTSWREINGLKLICSLITPTEAQLSVINVHLVQMWRVQI